MSFIASRRGQAFSTVSAVSALPKNGAVTVPVGLKCDAGAVCTPHRRAVVAAECESLHGCRTRTIVDVYDRFLVIVGRDRDVFAVGRDVQFRVGPGRQRQFFEMSLPITDDNLLVRTLWKCDRSGNKNQRTRVGDAELGAARQSPLRASYAGDHRHRRAADFEPALVEMNREYTVVGCVHKMAGRDVTRISGILQKRLALAGR